MPAPKRAPLRVAAPAERAASAPCVARVVSASPGGVRVAVPGVAEPVRARVSAGLDDAALADAASEGQDALVVFEGNDVHRPVVVALLRSETPLIDAVLAAPARRPRTATVDGERVAIEGKDDVVLRCGKASIVLRRDGTIELKGVKIVTQASGVQKIRGARVQIN